MTDREKALLAQKIVDTVAQNVVTTPGLQSQIKVGRSPKNKNEILFQLIHSSEYGNSEVYLDPLPFANHLIDITILAGHAVDDNTLLAHTVLNMIVKLARLHGLTITESGVAAVAKMRSNLPLAGISLESTSKALVMSNVDVRTMLELCEETRRLFLGFPKGRGNKAGLSLDAEVAACEQVAREIPQFTVIKRRYRTLQKDWERERLSKNQSANIPQWAKQWKEIVGPKEYSHLSEDTLASFVDREAKKQTPTFLACSHIAPDFGLLPTTLESKFKAWKQKHKSSKFRTQTV